MSAHARLSSSSADRWMTCPGSLKLEEASPVREEGPYAEEGTLAHSVCESLLCCLFEKEITAREPVAGENDEMYKNAKIYAENIFRYLPVTYKAFVEKRVDMSKTLKLPDTFGTVDLLVVGDDCLQLHDFKYGRGVAVYSEENKQLMMYALGAIEAYGERERIELFIHQPRIGIFDKWSTTPTQLTEFAKAATVQGKLALRMADDGFKVELHPSIKGCRFCKAKPTCPALHRNVDEYFKPVSIESTSDEQFEILAGKVQMAKIFISSIEEEVKRRLKAGFTVKGFKLVGGRRGVRKWLNEEKALSLLGSDYIEKRLLSPTRVERRNKADYAKVASLVISADPSLVVVKEESMRIDVTDYFKKKL